MKAEEIHDEIRFIREMVEKTRKQSTGSGWYLIIWGALIIIALAVMYVLAYLEAYQFIWLDWIVLMGIGVVATLMLSKRYRSQSEVKTYAEENVHYLWFASGIAFLLTAFVFPMAGAYSTEVIPMLVSTIAGLGLFVSGGIYEWTFMKICGLVWWVAAIIMIFLKPEFRGLLLIPATFFGYLLPGIIVNRLIKKGGER